MKKLLLSEFAFVLSAGAAFASDVVETVTPTATAVLKNMTETSGYNSTLTLTDPTGKHTYTVYGFNNNKNSWNPNPMRCGSTSTSIAPYTATISTDFMILASVD